MKMDAPNEFDVHKFFSGHFLYQTWEIFPGLKTKGDKDVVNHLDRLGVPARMDGIKVLDIAPWNGFFGFECLRRGAKELVSLGPEDPNETGYMQTKNLLGIDNCSYFQDSVYNLSPAVHGFFDAVFCLGLIYHLRHPLLALDLIHDVCTSQLYIDSPVMDDGQWNTTLSQEDSDAIYAARHAMNKSSFLYFSKDAETGDSCNWFIPNSRALCDLVESSGFEIDHFDLQGGWASIKANKVERKFVKNLEGFNAAVLKNVNR